MRLKIANRVFAPQPWAALLTLAAIGAFGSLGTWQVGRAQEKRAMLASFERGMHSNRPLGSAGVEALPRFQHVTVKGRYDPQHQVLLDNMPSSTGEPGYRVLTPFVRAGSPRLLLVDRGWVPLGPTRAQLPAIGVDSDARVAAGRLDQLPVPGIRVGPAGSPGVPRWPRVLNFPTQADLESVLAQPVESRIVLLDAGRPDGFERAWRPALGFPPERHIGYAVQWFALAIVALVIFVALSIEPDQPGGASQQ
jgi:surfeit locus 1 family protein